MAMNNNNFTVDDNAYVQVGKMQCDQSQIDARIYKKLINAVEIDWNAAKLPDANPDNGGQYGPISDTAQLLDLINTMQKEIYVLTAAVIALAQR